ncbi:MAG: acylneuraminate cytidylyltransferase family protein [Acidimicrobiia bacterium]|nr:acylneuraminate cytidylyltransferase family protein [Acidimicrobiia bacterium]
MRTIDIFIPLKGKSERVPGKNMRPFGGRPLFHTIVATLEAAERVGGIYIDTDSDVIAESAAGFDTVTVVRRKDELLGHEISVNWLIKDFLVDHPHVEHLGQTHCTNPLLSAATIDAAVDAYFANDAVTSLFTVDRIQARLYDKAGEALNHNPEELLPTQDLDPIYLENSNLYLFERKAFFEEDARITSRTMMWEMDPYESVDIDEEKDFRMAEALHRSMMRLEGTSVERTF